MSVFINGFFAGEMKPTTTVGGCIDVFENAWPDPKSTIELIENECLNIDSGVKWSRAGTIGDGINQTKRTNYDLGITSGSYNGNAVAQDIHNQMYFLLLATTIPYAKKHDIPTLYHEPYNMLKYSGGQKYDAHADGGTETGRAVSAIIYLNDDFEGGEVEFVNFGIKIKPQPGLLLLFPSTYPYAHIAHPVTSGTKYALVTWIRDRKIA